MTKVVKYIIPIFISFRRCAIALESIAESQKIIAGAARPQERRKPKLASLYTPSVEELNDVYGEEHGR